MKEESAASEARPLFPHRPWMRGIVLILAVLAILGGTVDPLWFWIGMPFILVLALYLYVRVRDWLRGKTSDIPE
ncbi:MAG: YgzB family protein [Acidobacteriota bacterium]|nr:YgzB family protein [Acidobacteriota bacterium]